MACCATTGCGDPACPVCSVPVRFPPIEKCPGLSQADQEPCRFVKGHRPPCKSQKEARDEKVDTSTRDGDPKLAAERKRGNLAFRKRQRAGALWVPPDRRV
jgi:hypothetical protein